MRKSLLIVIALSILFLAGCRINNIKTNSLDKIIIASEAPASGETGSYNENELKTFTSKEEIKRVAAAIENAKKETVDLQYEGERGLHYMITLYYKGQPKNAYTVYLKEDSDRAVFTNGNYYYMDKEDTKWLKSFIYK